MKHVCSKIRGYLKSARLESIIVTSTFLIIAEWYSIHDIPLIVTLLTIFSLALIVTAGSWQNYVYDIEIDKKAGKNIGFFQYISPKEMLFFSFILIAIALGVLWYIDFYAFIIGLIEAIVFLIYSAPPIRLKTKAVFDFIANSLVFGAFPFFIGYTITQHTLNRTAIAIGLILGLLAGSYYLFISSFEIESDKKAGVKNTCTYLGFKHTINIGITIFLLSFILYLIFFNFSNRIILVSYLVSLPLVALTKFTKNTQIKILLVSFIFLIWNGAILLLISIYTTSIISILLFLVILAIFIMAIYTYMVTEV